MIPRPFLSPSLALALLAAATTPPALAQNTTISAPSTTAQTIASGNTLTVTSTGALTISGSTTAVTMSGGTATVPTTLSNSGAISQTGTGRAVRANVTGSNLVIQNLSGGSITAVGNDTITVGSSTVTASSVALTNAGSISNTNGNQAVNFGNLLTGTNSVTNSGQISATLADAVRPGVNGTVTNNAGGQISSTASTTSGSDGIDAQGNTGVSVANSGLIQGGRHGVTGGYDDATATGYTFAVSINNAAGNGTTTGVLTGANGSGVNIDGKLSTATIINSGLIQGTGTNRDGDGVDVDGVVNLTNSGTIISHDANASNSEGVTVGGGTITNNAGGVIEGDVASNNTTGSLGRGITVAGIDTAGTPEAIYANTVITNSGTIRGQSESGINVGSGGPASGHTVRIVNNAGGLIEGGGTTAAIVTGADNDTIVNSGTIKADSSGLAIDLGGGTNTLQITGGAASIIGNVSGGAASTNSALTIDPGSGNKFSYSGAFSNFATVAVSSGTVTLSGASTYTGPTTVAGNATLVAANTGGSATGSGRVIVQASGTLAGNGLITGAVELDAGGRISLGVGTTVGTLTVGEVDLTDGSRLVFKLGVNAAASDLLKITGGFDYTGSGQVLVDLSNNGGLTTGHYTLVTFGSEIGLTVGSFSLGNVPAGFSGTFDLTGGTLGLTVNAVPEPSALAFCIAGGLTLAVGVRRRMRRQS